jgi:hypothetical protein
MELHLDEREMAAEVLKYVQMGMPVDDAKRVMEAQGFKCCYDRDRWAEMWYDADPAQRGEVYLVCSRFKPQPSWWASFFMSDEIKVFLSFKDGKVAAIRVQHIPCCA